VNGGGFHVDVGTKRGFSAKKSGREATQHPGSPGTGRQAPGILKTGPDAVIMQQKSGNGERARSLLCGREALTRPAGAAETYRQL